MNPIFEEAADHVDNQVIREWKAQGKKVIGHTCSHVPEEIISAAGMMPYRLRGIESESTSIGDTYFGPFICSCPKAILQKAGEGAFNFLDGAVMVQSCDSMRRLDECWRAANDDYPGILPGFWHYLGVPHKAVDYSLKWFSEEIEMFKKHIEEHFNVTITEENLRKSITLYNETRDLLKELDEVRGMENTPVSGQEAMNIILAGTAMPKEVYNPLLREALDELKARPAHHGGKKRILLGGSVVDDQSLISVIEAEGAVVVADTVCFGSRSFEGMVPEDSPTMLTIAGRYLHHQFCPRMFGHYKDRMALIKQKMELAKVDGVILQNIRFCDLHGSENGLFEAELESMGVPAIRLEREYGAMADEGRLRMRIGAFLESIPERRTEKPAA
ncbi:Benzoyl-CoA reductase/2-hydroxyglutaryl-CoA dehydratase subunit, BcrC/BadD/HgdB [Desulfatibacillum alkenivorans DSM 16219]|jgi:benzoyl-CoA reductase/2-hydroxyglutaryl-CoA dehydratase subunit BcrC/BadD/HgdB|uniref:Benzoyl-CoA reductase/2-hydroxyglutaryl-CoA dehydratase subunit, BcrC/BadD/HgdB n=1 Tax=Desulfatibacillum alkenivorans DSM 16219 TaxID=1121393 RepID=A0A1M6P476_9BACT|nr:2-hydroxyacyl-CoA dehydratase family protein [Desulfatibacillum alkenivorans]SHK02710.1 Benzoyl-CoA reductase/2-hydroxyglutaryl-CoA dehydratase subunit, BcrC/BadD/HgdB [Desulfatibacillum alkenivorans DSM 16219]